MLDVNDYRMDDVKREEDEEEQFFCHCDHIVKNVKKSCGTAATHWPTDASMRCRNFSMFGTS